MGIDFNRDDQALKGRLYRRKRISSKFDTKIPAAGIAKSDQKVDSERCGVGGISLHGAIRGFE